MSDEELVRGFETCTLPGDQFTHAAHVRVAWHYLRRHDFAGALARFSRALRRYAAVRGAEGKYHETITIAYMLLIAERLDGCRELSWDAFAARHPDLLARQPSVLARYYTDETLQSERARRTFVMPDRPDRMGERREGAYVIGT